VSLIMGYALPLMLSSISDSSGPELTLKGCHSATEISGKFTKTYCPTL
jgi:hypothetical protein